MNYVKTIIVFLKHDDGPSGDSILPQSGDIVWSSKETVQIEGIIEPDWDEVKVIEFPEESECDEYIKQLKAQKDKLGTCKVCLLNSMPKEMIKMANESFKNSQLSSEDTASVTSYEELAATSDIDVPRMLRGVERLRSLEQTKPILAINFFKYHDFAVYPEDYEGKKRKISGKKNYNKYGRIVQKFMPLYGIQILNAGDFLSLVMGDYEADWDGYAFVIYPSINILEKMTTSKVYLEVAVHRNASLKKSNVYISLKGNF